MADLVAYLFSVGGSFDFHPFSSAEAPGSSTGIVLLGAGTLTVRGYWGRMGVLVVPSAARVLEAERVFGSSRRL